MKFHVKDGSHFSFRAQNALLDLRPDDKSEQAISEMEISQFSVPAGLGAPNCRKERELE